MQKIITIDGPAASGKSSVAKAIALELAIPFISSGLLYRAAGKVVSEKNVDASDAINVLEVLNRHEVTLRTTESGDNLIFDFEEDITAMLHNDVIDTYASKVAKHPKVRDWVNARLQEIQGDFVIDGRDMGHVVFPEAAHKFYLTASAEVRAQRRLGERDANLQELIQAIKERDERDSRQLEPSPQAIHIDTSTMTLDEVIASVLGYIKADAADI